MLRARQCHEPLLHQLSSHGVGVHAWAPWAAKAPVGGRCHLAIHVHLAAQQVPHGQFAQARVFPLLD